MFGKEGELSPKWKGDGVGYWGLHDWVNKVLGSPKECEFCGSITSSRYEWANISKKYRRIPEDWVRLCKRCHNNYDGVNIYQQPKFSR